MNYFEAKQQMIEALRRAATAHDSGQPGEIEDLYDTFDEDLPRDSGPEFDKLLVAFEFWSGWLDARNHDWKLYEGIQEPDWPRLARLIAADLEADREIEDEMIVRHLDFRKQMRKPSLLQRISNYISRMRGNSHFRQIFL